MAGGVSLVLVGLICAFWVLVGEFSLSDGVAFTMFFTAVIAVLVDGPGASGRTPLRRELDVQQAWELAADGRKLPRPDLVGARVLATPTGRIKRMRRGEDVVVLAVIPPEEIVGADLRLV
jgi:hypothetical protein